MNIQGEKVIINKSANQVYEIASNPEKYRDILPDNITKFEVNQDEFRFAIDGMPEISLCIKEKTPNSKIVLGSSNKSLDFDLTLLIEKLEENSSEIQFIFDGKFNMFISAMVEKPITNFIKTITEKAKSI